MHQPNVADSDRCCNPKVRLQSPLAARTFLEQEILITELCVAEGHIKVRVPCAYTVN